MMTEKQIAKKLRREALLARPCNTCGQPINNLDKRQVRCQLNCPGMKVEALCCVCGKAKEVYKSQQRENHCCSLECQRQHALVDNHSCKNTERTEKQLKDIREAYRMQSRLRRKSIPSVSLLWWRKCKKPIESLSKDDVWLLKCRTASQTIKERASFREEEQWKLTCLTWTEAINNQIRIVKAKASIMKSCDWTKKCTSVARNIKHRLIY